MTDSLAGWAQQAHVVDTVHHRIHQGRFYTTSALDEAVASDGTLEFLLKLTSANEAHGVFVISTNGSARFQLFEGTTVSANGTTLNVMNRNRESTRAATLTAFKNPTITADGTQLDGDSVILSGHVNSGGAIAASFTEMILKPATNYLVRLTNTAAQAAVINVAFHFYEPTHPY